MFVIFFHQFYSIYKIDEKNNKHIQKKQQQQTSINLFLLLFLYMFVILLLINL